MKENIILFLTHLDDYLDVCLGIDEGPRFDIIRKMNIELKLKRNSITLEEYRKIEADNFYEYLKLVDAISECTISPTEPTKSDPAIKVSELKDFLFNMHEVENGRIYLTVENMNQFINSKKRE